MKTTRPRQFGVRHDGEDTPRLPDGASDLQKPFKTRETLEKHFTDIRAAWIAGFAS